jgi:hypothetical protein
MRARIEVEPLEFSVISGQLERIAFPREQATRGPPTCHKSSDAITSRFGIGDHQLTWLAHLAGRDGWLVGPSRNATYRVKWPKVMYT